MQETKPGGGGRTRLGLLVFLLVLAAGLYLANKFIPPYWNYLSLVDPVKEAALVAATRQGGEGQARAQLLAAAKAQGVDLAEDDIEITREASGLTVRVSWVTPVELPRYRYDLHFSIAHTAHLP